MIGKVIQEKRKVAGLTQAQLAELLGVTAPAVNRWEKDLCFPDATLLAPLARCLHTDLNGLFSFYDSLSEKERQLILDRAGELLIHSSDEEALSYISDVLKQNLSDGLLYKKMADLLYGFHVMVKAARPTAYLKEAAAYYERAVELLPEIRGDVLSSLIGIYSQLGEREKAEAVWKQLPEHTYSKSWLHAEMLYSLQDYTHSVEEVKQLVLNDIIDLSLHLNFLEHALALSGNSALAALAAEKASAFREMFALWHGMETLSLISKAVSESDADSETENLIKLIQSNRAGNGSLSACRLFEDVELGGKAKDKTTTADHIADLLKSLNKLA